MTRARNQQSLPRLSVLAASVLVALGALPAYALDPTALPTGGQVAAGSATISQSGARMEVNQATPKAILNWSSFNIGSGASVNFAQPSASSVALNRVTSASGGSEILGRLSANGQVFLVNPNGVLFGKTAQVDVGALVATSLNISDANFLAGRYSFASTGTAGSVINQGTLRAAEGGYIALLAPEVRNEGVIAARLGTVALGAGNKVTLDFAGDRLVSLVIDEAALNALVENRHVVQADGGTVIFAARSAGDLASTVVNNTGLIQAASISERDGVIRLEGGERGIVAVSGTLDASGRGAGERGGTIKVLGEKVGLFSGATLDASGDAGGGTVLVGGNYQGSGPEQNASATHVAVGAQIKADALASGDGGRVIVWSNDYTAFNGAISARGGAYGGNGGFVETSSHGVLSASGLVNTLAPLGAAGVWLLDPTDMTITASADANVSASSPFQPTASGSVLTWATIDAALAGGNVSVQTTAGFDAGQPGNITIANPYAYARANSLTLTAANSIVVNGSVTNFGAGALTLTAGGAGSVAVNQNLSSTGGTITLTGGSGGVSMANGTAINAGAGLIAIDAGGGDASFGTGLLQTSNATAAAISVTNASTLELGNIALSAAGTLTLSHSGAGSQNAGTSIVGAGNLTKNGTGTLTLGATNTYAGATTINAGTVVATKVANAGVASSFGSGTTTPGITVGSAGSAATLSYSGNTDATSRAITIGGAGGGTIEATSAGQTLNLSGAITGGGNALTFAGAGNIVASGVIGGAGTTLTSNMTGMLTLSAANTYTGLTAINAGIVDVRNNTGLGTVAGATTIASGAAVQVDGSGLAIAEPITSLSGTGIGSGGALRNLANNNTWSGAITLGGGSSITSDAGTLTLSAALTGGGNALTFGGAGNITESNIISGVGTALTMNGTGTLTLSGANTYTGTTTISAGTLQVGAGGATGQLGTGSVTNDSALVFNRTGALTVANAISGAGTLTQNGSATITLQGANTYTGATSVNNGSLTLSGAGTATGTAFTVNRGGILNLDNTATNVADRIADGNALTLNGGEFQFRGANVAATNASETVGALTLASGDSTVSVFSGTGGSTRLTFASANRSPGASVLFRGANLGANPGAGNTNINFTNAAGLNLTGGGGAAGTTSINIVPYAFGDTAVAGAGISFVTHNVDANGNTNGIRPLAVATEYVQNSFAALAANQNVRINAATAAATRTVNSLLITGGGITNPGAAAQIDVTSGAVATTAAQNIAGANTTLAFGATEAVFQVAGNSTVSAAITGSGGLTKGRASTLTLSGANTYTGNTAINAGTLADGAAGDGQLPNANTVTIAPGAILSLAANSETIGALTLVAGTATGASATSTTGTLTLGGDVALNVNGSGATVASITGNLDLGGATRTFTVTDGAAASDLTITAIVSGVGLGLTKAGAGTLTLSGANTYSGGTTISAGTLSGTVANAFGGVGGGTITIGDASGNAATLSGGAAIANAITVAGTGVNTITNSAAATFSGLVTLSSQDLNVVAPVAAVLNLSGGIGGTGNLVLQNNSATANAVTISTAAANNAGTITNSGTGTQNALLSGGVGANVTSITENSATSALTVSGALTTNASGTTLTNSNSAGSSLLTVSGAVGGTGALVLNNNSAINNGITLSNTVNAASVTNSGTGIGATLISGVVGAGVTGGVTQDSTSSALNFTVAANTYTSGLTIKSGTVTGTVANSFGANANVITIGHSTGSANATLSGAGAVTYANPIVVASGNTGVATITDSAASIFSGTVTLNSHDLTLSPVSSNVTLSGSVTSTGTGGSLLINATNTGTVTLSGASINNSGTITNSGAGTGAATVSGVIGANVTGAIENSLTSSLTLSGNNAAFAGGTLINAGTLTGATSVNAFGTGAITIGDSSGVANATLRSASALTYANAISVAAGNTGVAAITDSANSTFSGAATLNSHDLVLSTVANSLTLSGAISSTGTGGNLALNSAGAGVVTLSNAVGGINNAGTITNMGAGAAANVISGVIGANVTGVVQNSATSSLTLSGTNTYTSTTTISAGTLLVGAGGATGTLGTGAGGVVDNGTLTFNRNNAMAVSTVISGTGAVIQAGTGTTTLSGANTYTGRTSIQNGALSVSSINSVAGGVVSSNLGAPTTLANGTIDLGSGANTGTLLYTGTGETTDRVLNLAGTTGGGIVTQSGTGLLKFTSAMTATGAGSKTFTLQGSTAGTGEIAGTIVDNGGVNTTALTKAGTGTWTLSGANTYTGRTSINAGVLVADTLANGGVASNIGQSTNAAANLVLGGGTLQYTGATVSTDRNYTLTAATTSTIDVTTAATTLTIAGASTATTGALTKSGSGTLELSGANLYTGATTVNAGTLQLGVTNAIGSSSAVTLNGTSTLDMNGFSDTISSLAGVAGTMVTSGVAGAVTLATGAAANTTFAGVIQDGAGTVALTKQGTGIFTLSGANTYTGTTNVNAGTLRLQGGAAIDDTNAVVLANTAGVTLDLRGSSETIGSLAGGGAAGGVVNNSTAATTSTLTTGDATDTTFAGVIQNGTGTVALTKQGAGTFTLSGANTYTGFTTVGAGTLAASNASALGTTASGTTVSSGATLNINNVAIGGEAISINGNGAGGAGALTGTGTASLAGALTLAGASRIGTTSGASTLTLNGAVNAAASALDITGAGNLTATNAANNFGTVTINSAGNVSLVDANALTIGTSSVGTLAAQTLSGNLSLGGSITATGTGDTIVLVAKANFNNSGGFALDPNTGGGGRWLVYSTNPASDSRGGLVYGFKQYNATFGVTTVADATNNGFLYTLAPTITPSLGGTATRVYDGTTTAPTGSLALSPAGSIDGDTVVLAMTGATYDTRNVGAGKTVTASGISASATNGAATVYGYQVSPTSASAAVGVITAAPLTVTAQTDSRGYNGTASSSVAPVVSGTLYDAVGTAASQVYDNKNVGTGKTLTASGLVVSDGNSGNNYAISYVADTTGVITAAPLTVTAQTDSRGYNGTASSSVAPVVSGTLYDAVGTAASQVYDNKNVGTGKTLTASGLVVSDGNSGNNYAISYVADTTGVITAAPLTVTAQTDSRGYNGTASSSVAPVVSGTLYDAVGTAASQVYDNKNVGTGKTLTASGLVVSDGNSGNNYAISYVADTTGVITAAPLTVTAQTDSRGYNGTASSSVAPVVSGTLYDAVGTAASQVYDNKNVGTGKTLTASGLVVSDGNSGNNYAISYVADTTGVITAAPLTVTAQTDSRGYNGTASSSVAPVVSGTLYDAVGTAASQVYDNKNVGTGKTLTASGLVVSDGNSGNNYAISYVADTTGVITAAPLTVTAQTDSRGYNGTASSSVAPVVSGTLYDAVGTAASQVYDNKNVGTGKTLTASGLVVSDGNSGNNYAISYVADTTGVITAAPLTVTAQTDSRGYNGTASSSVAPVVSGTLYDAVGTAASQVYDNKNVGTGKTLTASGLVVSDGNSGNNYAISYVADTTGVITAAPLTVTAQTDSRGYNGTASSSVAPVVSGTLYDAVGTAASQVYDNKNVGTGKTLTASGLVVSDGNSGNNYAISYVADTTGVITAAPLTVTAQTDSRGYNGTASSSVAPVVSGTLYDAVGTAASQVYDNKNVGTGKTLTASGLVVSDGNSGNNYAISYVADTTGVITAAPLTVTAQTDSRGYNGTASSSVAPVVSGTLYDAVGTAASQVYDNKNVGTGKTLTASGLVVSDGNSGNNYAISYVADTTGVITAAPLTVTAQTDSRGYNGTASSSVAPVVSGTLYDAVGTAASQVYDNKNVGTGKTLTASGLVVSDGNSGNNYAISYVADTTGVITAAPLTVTAQTDSRGYNGTASSSVAPVVSGTLYDAVGTAASQVYDNKNVGTGKTLTASGLVVSDGNSGNNYAISYVADTTGVITAAPLTVTAQTDSRGYNGTASSSVAPVVSGTLYDAVGTAASQVYDNKNVGTGKTLTASGLVVSDGNSGNNYAISYVADTTGVITAAPLTVTAQTDSRGYNGTASSSVAPVVSGTLYDAVGTAASQVYDNKNVGTGKTLTASGLVVSDGNSGNNYAISYVADTTGVITAAPLTVTAQTDSRGYNGTASSSVAPVVSGTLYDAVGTAASQVYDNKNVGTGKTLTASGLVVSDGNSGNNYAISYVADTTGVITAAPLTVTAQTDSRGYNGTASSSVAPVVSGTLYDAVGTAASQVYDNKNVGTGKTLTASGLVVSDGNSGNNYAISYVADTTGVITAAPLTVTAQTDSRGYNGTASSSVAPVVSGTLYDAVGTAASQVYDNKNVGTGKTLTASGLVVSDGNSGNNYAISYVADTTGVITAAPLTVTAQTDSRGYNGTASSSVAPVVSGTLYDAVGTAASQVYDNKNVGTGKTLTASGLVVSDGNSGNNYAISYVADTTGVITAAPLTVTAQTDSRGYNGTASSSVAPVVSGTLYDAVGTAASQVYDNKNVGTGKTLTASGLVVSDGNSGNNYAISYVADTTGVITAAPLTVTAQTDSRGYNGTASSSVAPVVSGTLYDAVGTAASQVYDNKNVGTGKTLTASGLVVSDGNSGNNYAISYVADTTGVITAAPLTVTAQTDSRGYNGTASSSVAPVVSGTLYDAVGTAASQVYDNKNVGTGKTLTASGLVVSDGNSGNNYAISYVADTTGVITAAPLTVTAQTDSRGYNGTASSSVAPVVSGTLYDAVGTAASQVYDNKNVGTGKTLTASGLVVSDGNSGNNYAISYVADTTGVITAAPLTVTADNQTRPELTPNPPFTATYGGFQVGDSASSLGGALAFATPATIASPVGAYPITPSGLTSANYIIAFNDGVLAVTAGTVMPSPPAASAFSLSAATAAIASTLNPPGGIAASVPISPEFSNTLAPITGGLTADGLVTVEHISPTISIINCGIRSVVQGCGPR